MSALRIAVAGFAAGLALAGCALGPDYARPATEVPAANRFTPDAAATGGSFGDLAWWQVYGDPVLQGLIADAVRNNLDVRIALARIEQARAALGSARLQQLPTIGIDGGETRKQTSDYQRLPNQPRVSDSVDAEATLSWEIDLWGRLRRLSEAARADLLASEYARRGVLVELVSNVATGYFNLVSFDEQLAITRRTVETRRKFVELTRAQHDRGVVSGLDVATAEAQLATAEANIPELERQAATTEDALSVLLGRNPGPITRVAGRLPAAAPVPPAGLPSSLLDRRPDVLQSEAALVAANARVGAAKAALFPSISLTGLFGFVSPELSNLFTNRAETWSIGGNLVAPILDPQRNLYQLDLADARKREALLSYRKTLQGAFQEVADALVSRQKYAESQAAQQRQVDAQRKANDIALARYRIGFSSYFDVVNADRDLFNAELQLSSASRNSLLAVVQLYRALGGGWDADRVTQPPADPALHPEPASP